MNISKEAQYFIDRCYKDGMAVAVKPNFNEKYDFDGVQVKFTESILSEIASSPLVKVSNQTEKQVSLNGIAGMKV